jgi:hypothetical protein
MGMIPLASSFGHGSIVLLLLPRKSGLGGFCASATLLIKISLKALETDLDRKYHDDDDPYGGYMFAGYWGWAGKARKILSALHLSPWGVLFLFLFIVYLAGFILDWASILLVFVPIFSPIIDKLGFSPIWFGTLFIMMIQTSYLTPPMAPAIFYLKGIAPPEVTTNEIFRGIWAFMLLQLIGITIVTLFPQIALWLPDQLLRW